MKHESLLEQHVLHAVLRENCNSITETPPHAGWIMRFSAGNANDLRVYGEANKIERPPGREGIDHRCHKTR
jgi:hypothetical protein